MVFALRCSIIIPTYNGKHLLMQSLPYTLQCLPSSGETEVLVVDNGSTDGTIDWIQETYPQIRTFSFSENRGFTAAVNKGIQEAQGMYALLLNNDCFLQRNTLDTMLQFLHVNPNYVATQPVVYTINNDIEHIGYTIDLWSAKAYPVQDPSQIPSPQERNTPFWISRRRYVYGLSGTCLLVSRSAIQKVGMFDETFHSYLEDVDLFLRFAARGYTYAPTLEASCTHAHMATSTTMPGYKQKRDVLNWVRIILKNYPWWYTIHHMGTLLLERLRNINGLIKASRT